MNKRINIKVPVTNFNTKKRVPTLDPYFEVKESRLYRSDGKATDFRALINGVTDDTMGIVSDRYNVVTHKQTSEIVKEFLSTIGLEYQSKGPQTSNAGSRYYETLIFPSLSFNPASQGNPDTAIDKISIDRDDHVPTITIKNSYDKTSGTSWEYGLYRLICSNGMATLLSESKVSFRHTQIVNPERVRDNLLTSLEESSLFMGRLYQRLNGENGSSLLVDLLSSKLPEKFKAKLLQQVTPYANIEQKEIEVNGKKFTEITSIEASVSSYAILNVATEISTHVLTNRAEQERVNHRLAVLTKE